MDILWEDACTKSKIFLSKYSDEYQRLKERKSMIMEKYPELIKVIEGDPLKQDLVLDNEKSQILSELIGISTDILWLYQKMFYLIGMTTGFQLAELMEQINEEEW